MSPPDEYGVIGHPISHSRSPFIHARFAAATGQNLAYRAHDVAPGELAGFIGAFALRGGLGLNVTVPHKVAAAALAQGLSERARRAGAINTLIFRNGEILADNTDGVGLVRDLTVNLGCELTGRRILIAGNGGAARGVIGPLLELLPACILVAGRTPARAVELAREFADLGPVRGCALADVAAGTGVWAGADAGTAGPFDLVINATSAGLGAEVAAIPAAAVGAGTFCYDMMYGHGETAFVAWARARGAAHAVAGWGMLVEQAAESFLLWRGVRPDTAPVLAELMAGAP
ncbi:MAG TPA: shikimate dehydrogenase [Steroidobacteraceae bacterium]|nr:shikimate dehydrogenase [Steroidobacteraceae bacterium]